MLFAYKYREKSLATLLPTLIFLQMTISIKILRKFCDNAPWSKIYKKAETASKGQRLYPSRSQDTKLNFRIDKGAKISENEHEIVIQANKDADDGEVKKSAQQDSHRILAKCVIDPASADVEAAKKVLEASFTENA